MHHTNKVYSQRKVKRSVNCELQFSLQPKAEYGSWVAVA